MESRIPRYTTEGVKDAEVSLHPVTTEDGLGLSLTRFHRRDADDVVLLVHGLTSSSDMYIMPEHRNLTGFLLDNGYPDVWTLDYRMSNRFPYDTETHRYTLDDVAAFDHPAALRELRRHIGDRRVHVITHCLGSVSFAMSLFGGAVDGIASLTCNSVALTPRVPAWSRLKLNIAPGLAEYVLGYSFLDPRYADAPPMTRGWLLSRAVSLFHRECDVRSCHFVSFMWGTGRPAMYEHDQLLPVTHERTADIYGAVGVHYYRHLRKMVAAGHVVKYDPREPRHAGLPDDYLAGMATVETPILLLTGDRNHVFTDSNVACHELLEGTRPGLQDLVVLPGYGHQDPFMGKNAHEDVFPHILAHLNTHSLERVT
jgi:pimeloyl-ACP methyl ester carboxylesterase